MGWCEGGSGSGLCGIVGLRVVAEIFWGVVSLVVDWVWWGWRWIGMEWHGIAWPGLKWNGV